jgi:hypothetical protein
MLVSSLTTSRLLKRNNLTTTKTFGIPKTFTAKNKNYMLYKTQALDPFTVKEFIQSTDSFATSMYFVSKSIILYALFYSTMNWFSNKRAREDLEQIMKQRKDENNKK